MTAVNRGGIRGNGSAARQLGLPASSFLHVFQRSEISQSARLSPTASLLQRGEAEEASP